VADALLVHVRCAADADELGLSATALGTLLDNMHRGGPVTSSLLPYGAVLTAVTVQESADGVWAVMDAVRGLLARRPAAAAAVDQAQVRGRAAAVTGERESKS
jgi:hypothetical protein